MATKTEVYTISILADDYSYAADSIIALFENRSSADPLPVKTFFAKAEGKPYRLYVDSLDDSNCYGKVVSITDPKLGDLDLEHALLTAKVDVALEKWDEDNEMFIGKVYVTKNASVVDKKLDKIPDDIRKVLEEKMKSGIDEKCRFAVEERIRYMLDNYVNKLDIIDVVNYWDVNLINKWGSRIPTYYVDPDLETSHKQGKDGVLSRAIQSYLMANAKILKGPKATGKNTCINSIIWLFGDKMEEHTFTIQDSKSDVISSELTDNSATERLKTIDTDILTKAEKIRTRHLADPSLEYTSEEDEVLLVDALFKQLSAEAASVHIIHEYRAFARWILDTTGHTVFVADEINMADANLLVGLLHPILDGSITEYDIPGRGLVPLASHLMMFATMNVGYAGEQEGNPATLSRFGAIELAQPASILGILHSAVSSALRKINVSGDLPEKYYKQAVKFYDSCVTVVGKDSAGEISDQCLNVRGIVRALVSAKRFEGRTTLRQKLEDEVVAPCEDSERPMLMAILNKTVTL